MIVNSKLLAELSKPHIQPAWFFWIRAKSIETGLLEETGIWSGIGEVTVVTDGVSRVYVGSGGLVALDKLAYSVGSNIASQTVNLSIISPEIEETIRGYNTRFAPVYIHLASFNTETMALSPTSRVFKGFIDSMKIGEAEVSLSLVSSMRLGSKSLTAKQSDNSQRKRDPNDTGRLYSSISGSVKTIWGSADHS